MMVEAFDLVVLGAGPAGASAAIAAAARGLRVVVVDENPAAGGQVYRIAPGIADAVVKPHHDEGDALRAALAASNADARFGHRVWQIERAANTFTVHAVSADGPVTLQGDAMIVASGAQERHFPVEGWQRPGVLSLAGATVLLKSQRMLPGHNVVVAGAGPLLLLVAAGIVKAGGNVAAVVDVNPRSAWLTGIATLASRPDLVVQGARWLATLVTHRVPILSSHALRRIDGDPTVTHVEALSIGNDGLPAANARGKRIDCDAVCMGFGLLPATDVTRLLGAAHVFDAMHGAWRVVTADDHACSVPRLFACGDGAGVAGAAAAPWQGRLAALAAARDLGRITGAEFTRHAAAARHKRNRAAGFGSAMARLANVRDAMIGGVSAETIVCQCEGLTRASLDEAIGDGCVTINDLRSATRCGMGPCGGRLCEDAAARLIAARTGLTREAIGQATGRPPLRPVQLDTLAGDFDYDALPMAQASPL